MCQTRVSSTRNATFASGNTLGRVLGGIKSPCGNGDTHSLGFPHQIGVFGYGKTLGRVFGGGKSPCGKHADSHPGFGQGPVSNLILMGLSRPWLKEWPSTHHHNSKSHTLGFEPGASGVRRPCANPLGNLTTVGHLAKASPDLSPHFKTQKPHFLTSFQQRKIKFSDA